MLDINVTWVNHIDFNIEYLLDKWLFFDYESIANIDNGVLSIMLLTDTLHIDDVYDDLIGSFCSLTISKELLFQETEYHILTITEDSEITHFKLLYA